MSKVLERPLPPTVAYDEDVVAWANAQAALLRAIGDPRLDIEHIADELESMGRADKNEIESRLDVILKHLLKWQFQPERRTRSWRLTLHEQRYRIASLIEDSPSLKRPAAASLAKRYDAARIYTSDETGLPIEHFPIECPWTFTQVIDAGFFPGPSAHPDLPLE